MKVYTKTGDKGTTSLLGGQRVPKDTERLEAYGTIDELNSYIGMIRNFLTEKYDLDLIAFIQNRLFDIGAELSAVYEGAKYKMPDFRKIIKSDIEYLESAIDKYTEILPKLKSFVMPAGSEKICWYNIARTVCRRAERRIISIENSEAQYKNVIVFVNRLSDLLFVMGRKSAKDENVEEILWNIDL